jgi:hypothetical protein
MVDEFWATRTDSITLAVNAAMPAVCSRIVAVKSRSWHWTSAIGLVISGVPSLREFSDKLADV